MKRWAGFTLIEMAVVVFLIGLIASMVLAAAKAQMASQAIRKTQSNEGAIKDALVTYLAANKRLPCPATGTSGVEGRVTTQVPPPNCMTYYGLVPYQALGLSKNAAMDGWDNLIAYGVSYQWTANFGPAPAVQTIYVTNTAGNGFNVGNVGGLFVNDQGGVQISNNAVAIIISQGPNGNGAYTAQGTQMAALSPGADESMNFPPANFASSVASTNPPPHYTNAPNNAFIKRDYTDNASATGGAFDDVVMVLSAQDLLAPLTKDGALQSAQGQWANLASNIGNYVVGQALSTCSMNPNSFLPQLSTDPWGNQIVIAPASGIFVYSPYPSLLSISAVQNSTTVANTNSYTIINNSQIPTLVVNGSTLGAMFAANPSLQNKCP